MLEHLHERKHIFEFLMNIFSRANCKCFISFHFKREIVLRAVPFRECLELLCKG